MEHSDWLVFGRDFTVRIITMGTVLLDIFSRTPAKFKLRKRKKIKKVKVWSWYKTNERGENVCLEKCSSKKSSAVNQKARPTFFSMCLVFFVRL